MTTTCALIQTVEIIAERWSVFDECVEFCKENRAVDPTAVKCCPNVDLTVSRR